MNECAKCGRLPVRSRKNKVCRSCGLEICARCQYSHFKAKHEAQQDAAHEALLTQISRQRVD